MALYLLDSVAVAALATALTIVVAIMKVRFRNPAQSRLTSRRPS